MTKLASPNREPAPFAWLEPGTLQRTLPASARESLPYLQAAIGDQVQLLVRSLVNYTVARQNEENRQAGKRVGIQLSVLNRRRRVARAWLEAIVAGSIDTATVHSLSSSWLPQLIGSGPELHRSARAGEDCIEFVRGASCALILHRPADNLLPEAHALHALEVILGIHLRAWRTAVVRKQLA
jgi:hypothetical protein